MMAEAGGQYPNKQNNKRCRLRQLFCVMYHFILRSFLILIIVCVVSSFIADRHSTIQSKFNPTGTYRLDIKTKKRDGEIYGYFGEIRVKMIDDSTIAVSFYVCKGAP